jgi:hypothetical protein
MAIANQILEALPGSASRRSSQDPQTGFANWRMVGKEEVMELPWGEACATLPLESTALMSCISRVLNSLIKVQNRASSWTAKRCSAVQPAA